MQHGLAIRLATRADADFLRELRNEPAVVAASRTDQVVDRSTHRQWLEATIQSPHTELFVVSADEVPIGQARLDAADDAEVVSIAIAPVARGLGHGSEVLAELKRIARHDLLAEVRTSNAASLNLFRRAGFVETAVDGDFAILRWSRDAEAVDEGDLMDRGTP
jgi:ribosomal protein S18 acetylase RimI-like enzyme